MPLRGRKSESGPPREAARLGRHWAAMGILFWLALVYLNYYPQFYAHFLP